jgi:hypothetical protein
LAQWSFDTRRLATGGALLDRAALARTNPAYRAVPARETQPNVVIPIPLGLIQAATDDQLSFDPRDPRFNVFKLVNLALYPPIFLELKQPTVPTRSSDIELFIAQDSLRLDLGDASDFIPTDDLEMGGLSRLFAIGFTLGNARFSVGGFAHNETVIGLDQNMRGFLRESEAALANTRYGLIGSGLGQTGLAPAVEYSLHVPGTGSSSADASSAFATPSGLYLGGAVRLYLGFAMTHAIADGGLTTGDPVFDPTNPVSADFASTVFYQSANDGFGTGFGLDVGAVYVAGPVEFGLGLNDVGNTSITWRAATHKFFFLDGQSAFTDSTVSRAAEVKTKIPMTFVANVGVETGGFVLGAAYISGFGGAEYRAGAERWFGPLALRGGLGLDTRNMLQFGWGTGVRLGSVGLDVGFATHSASISGERGLRLATSLAIY